MEVAVHWDSAPITMLKFILGALGQILPFCEIVSFFRGPSASNSRPHLTFFLSYIVICKQALKSGGSLHV